MKTLRNFVCSTRGSMAIEIVYAVPAALMLTLGAVSGAAEFLASESAHIVGVFQAAGGASVYVE